MVTGTNPCTRRARAALALLLVVAAHVAHAQAVYKCRDAQGHIAYQDRVCPGAATQTQVALAPAPEPTPSPEYSAASSARSTARTRAPRAPTGSRRGGATEAVSYECRAGNGEVFYRHGACPKSIAAHASAGKRRGAGAEPIAVSALPLPRAEACRRLRASVGRSGHARDEVVSTYEHNLGRDPCR